MYKIFFILWSKYSPGTIATQLNYLYFPISAWLFLCTQVEGHIAMDKGFMLVRQIRYTHAKYLNLSHPNICSLVTTCFSVTTNYMRVPWWKFSSEILDFLFFWGINLGKLVIHMGFKASPVWVAWTPKASRLPWQGMETLKCTFVLPAWQTHSFDCLPWIA